MHATETEQSIPDALVASLIHAAQSALSAAIHRDLPPVSKLTAVLPQQDPIQAGLSQSARRNLHAAGRMYGIRLGEIRADLRRPEIEDTRTLIIPQKAGYGVLVLCGPAAALYAAEAGAARLLRVFASLSHDQIERIAGGDAESVAESAA